MTAGHRQQEGAPCVGCAPGATGSKRPEEDCVWQYLRSRRERSRTGGSRHSSVVLTLPRIGRPIWGMLRVERVDLDQGLLVVVGEGEVGYQNLSALWDTLRSRPDWPCLNKHLYDLTNCAAMLEGNEVLEIVERERREAHLASGKCVAVVSRVPVTYGMARMFQMRGELTRNYEVKVFRSLAAAHAWLADVGRDAVGGAVPVGDDPCVEHLSTTRAARRTTSPAPRWRSDPVPEDERSSMTREDRERARDSLRPNPASDATGLRPRDCALARLLEQVPAGGSWVGILERREYERVLLRVPVLCEPERGLAFGAVMANLGRGGARIECAVPPPRDLQVVLAVRFPGAPELSRLPATVRWNGNGAFGVQFDALQASVAGRIAELVAGAARSAQ